MDYPVNNLEIIEKAKYLTSLLSIDRTNNNSDLIKVGNILHNIDTGLLDTWIEFSKKSLNFNIEECNLQWKLMKNEEYSIKTLMKLAKNDNNKKYNELIKKEFNYLLEKSLSENPKEIAKAIHYMYQDKYVYIGEDVWYEFREYEHKWSLFDNSYTLYLHINKEFLDELTKYINISDEKINTINNKIATLIENLNDITFKKKIMEKLKYLFSVNKFEEQLDTNKDLIGFKNGVYDLKENVFRDGQPDDLISLSTNIDYIPFSKKHLYYEKMIKIIEEILPNENVRKYFITKLSTCVSGHNKEQNLAIIYNPFSSSFYKIIEKAFGNYYKPASISILIPQKRSLLNIKLSLLKGVRLVHIYEKNNDKEVDEENNDKEVDEENNDKEVDEENNEEEDYDEDYDEKYYEDNNIINVGIMKEITGEDKITERGLFKEPIEFYPQFKAFMIVKTLPIIPSMDDGTWRRIKKIDMGIKKNDEDNDNIIAPIFMSYLINIYINDYLVNGLVEPEEIKNYTNEFKNSNKLLLEKK